MNSSALGKRSTALSLVLVLAAAMLGWSALPARADVNTTEGTEFWVTFNQNNTGTGDLQLYLSAENDSNVTVYWPGGTTTTVSVSAGTVETVDANTVGADPRAQNSVNSATEGTASNGIRIVATEPVSVYGAHIVGGTSDAFTAIPTTSLGTRYRALSDPQELSHNHNRLSIIAAESGPTTVTITPTEDLAGGNSEGVAYTVSLTQGQVYTVQPSSTGSSLDLSGTLIESTQRVVVTSGDDCANFTGGACDHLVQYLPPTTAWGASFILPGSINSSRPDFYRIVADQDGTEISIDGTSETTLAAGEVLTFTPSGSQADTAQLLESSKPVLVGHMLQNGNYSGQTGDPSFSIVTPSLQFLTAYNFATPASGFSVNTLTVVAKTADVASISIPGVTLASFSEVSDTAYSVSRTVISAGSYAISGSSGLAIYVAGFNSNNSYSYPGGYALVDLVENPGGVEEVSSPSSPSPSVSSGANSTPGIFMYIHGQPGTTVQGSRISHGSVGGKPNSEYSVVLQPVSNSFSAKIVLSSGTTNDWGHADKRLEMGELDAGTYKVVMTGTHRLDYPLVLTNYISIDGNGNFISLSPESLQPTLN